MNLKKCLLQILILLFFSYIVYIFIQKGFQEPFVGHLYRPHIRTINTFYETFMNNYGPHRIVNKINKWFNY